MRRLQITAALVAAAMFSGCAGLFEPEQPIPEPDEEAVECDWEELRGVAEFAPTDAEPNRFVFYPGEHGVVLEEHDAAPGEEYKAVFEIPVPEDCATPRLELIAPVGAGPDS